MAWGLTNFTELNISLKYGFGVEQELEQISRTVSVGLGI